jgi:hypothetical protein
MKVTILQITWKSREEFKLLAALSLGITFLWKEEFVNMGNYSVV